MFSRTGIWEIIKVSQDLSGFRDFQLMNNLKTMHTRRERDETIGLGFKPATFNKHYTQSNLSCVKRNTSPSGEEGVQSDA